MKRVISIGLIIILLFSITGCAIFPSRPINIKSKNVSTLTVTRNSDNKSVSFNTGDSNIAKFLNDMNKVLYLKDGDCSNNDSHTYTIDIRANRRNYTLQMNDDGSVCLNGTYYKVDFSSKEKFNLSQLDRWIDAPDKENSVGVISPEGTDSSIIQKEEVNAQEIANSIIKIISQDDIATVEGVSYFTAEAYVLEENCVIIASKSKNSITNIYYKAPADTTIDYVDGSFEQSGGNMLYFNAYTKTSGSSYSLAIDMKNQKAVSLHSSQSSNFVLFDTPEVAILGLGWILTDNAIVPISISTGVADTNLAFNISEEPVAKVINNSFFSNFITEYDKKTVTLETKGNNKLVITVKETSTKDNPDIITTFEFDCVNKTLVQI